MIDGFGVDGAASGYAAGAVACSLHTDDPGTTGAHEVTGGTPAYARQPIIWSAGSAGSGEVTSAVMSFPVPAGVTVTWVALWDGSGNYLDKGEVLETFADQGVYEVDLAFTVA